MPDLAAPSQPRPSFFRHVALHPLAALGFPAAFGGGDRPAGRHDRGMTLAFLCHKETDMQNNLTTSSARSATEGQVSIRANDFVFRRNGKPITTSLKVAELFGKQHKNVLRDIDNLLKLDPDLRLSFEPEKLAVPTGNGGTRHVRSYAINQRGAALLVTRKTLGPLYGAYRSTPLDMAEECRS